MAFGSHPFGEGSAVSRESIRSIRSVRSTAAQFARVFDAVCALAVMLVIFVVLNIDQAPADLQDFLAVRLSIKNFVVAILFVAIWHFTFAMFGLYHPKLVRGFRRAAFRIALACSAGALCFLPFMAVSRTGAFGLRVVVAFWAVCLLTELLGRAGIAAAVRYAERTARDIRLLVIVGSGSRALALWRAIQASDPREQVVLGFVDTWDMSRVSPEIVPRVLGELRDLEGLLSREPVDQVLIALPVKSCYADIQEAINVCERVGVEVSYSPDVFPVSRARRELDEDGEMPVMRLHHVADDHRLLIKRLIDLVGAAAGLIVLSPLLLLCALAVRTTSPGPVVFAQVRYGFNRRKFRMYKFRTMVHDAETLQGSLESSNEAKGPVFKIRADPRITRIGAFMRRTSLDELPQLVNILRGDMSFVGPRPLAVRDVLRFDSAWLLRRFSVKPGLTCLWQVNGRSNTDFERWVRLDLQYIDNWSLSLDMVILIKTVPAVFSGTGAM